MADLISQLKKHRETLQALAAAAVCLLVVCLIWLVAVRPNAAKSLSQKISDDYTLYSDVIEDGQSASQSFTFSGDLYAMAFVFGLGSDGVQPTGNLELTLSDADTGEELAHSVGDMGNILPAQYTGMGLDVTVPGHTDRHYLITLTPHYTGDGRLSVGHSNGATLWEDSLTVNGTPVDGTLSLIVTYERIGGYLTRFFLLIGLAVSLIVFFGIRAALRQKIELHRLVFALVLAFGMVYSFVLPPYAAPDEKYHINQSFTLACRWANTISSDEWKMGNIPITMSYRRENDFNPRLQDEQTTVFSWRELTDDLFTVTPDSFDSHVELNELQTDLNPILYLPSAAAVFLCFVLHLGFVPTLMLGRLANLLVFALLAALAVRAAPFGKRIFAAAALLPMTLHLAASFSRDAMLLGLCFAFTALCADAIFGKRTVPLTAGQLLPLALTGLLLAPAKAVYLPLTALVLLIPSMRLGAKPMVKKCLYLAACVVLTICMNSTLLAHGAAATSTPDTAVASSADAEAASPHNAPAAPDSTSSDVESTSQALPENPDEASAFTLPDELQPNTLENFVRRLYYCTGKGTDVPQREIDFWTQALQDSDVSITLLGQSFFFAPGADLTDEEFAKGMTLTYLGRTSPDWAAEFSTVTEGGTNRRFFLLHVADSAETALWLEGYGLTSGNDDPDRYPLDRSELQAEVEHARAVRESQSTPAEQDLICFTPLYILTHPGETLALVARSVLANGDHYLRTLVGGSLSYYSLDVAWFWVLALYLLLVFAAAPAENHAAPVLLPHNAYRVWGAVAALLCCALAVGGCLTWTPTYYDTIYGLQGRYFLPVLPLLLLTCVPRVLHIRDEARATALLVGGMCLANAGVLINAMLAVIAR